MGMEKGGVGQQWCVEMGREMHRGGKGGKGRLCREEGIAAPRQRAQGRWAGERWLLGEVRVSRGAPHATRWHLNLCLGRPAGTAAGAPCGAGVRGGEPGELERGGCGGCGGGWVGWLSQPNCCW